MKKKLGELRYKKRVAVTLSIAEAERLCVVLSSYSKMDSSTRQAYLRIFASLERAKAWAKLD